MVEFGNYGEAVKLIRQSQPGYKKPRVSRQVEEGEDMQPVRPATKKPKIKVERR
jgi:hypothetical protein